MVTWALDVAGGWDGPEWAAPEYAERISSVPAEGGTLGPVEHVLVRALGNGAITAAQYQEAMRLKRKGDLETRDWTEDDWLAWEAANPE